ncbi:MAG: hypothetical protein FD167_1614 [bacterium]|nr:MAG: hypothetical protein FD167_1614 [bacterium]
MKNIFTDLWLFILILFILCFVPTMVLADGKGKTDIKAMSTSMVFDIEGNPFQLGNAWQEKPVVLVFIRHFG